MITLKTLAEATEQQVFDQVAQHLLSQNTRSTRANGNACAYRGQMRNKCAAGCLISDEEYTPVFDMPQADFGTSWDSLISRGLVPSDHQKLVVELQRCHDTEQPEFWHGYLNAIAIRFKLNTNVLGEK